MGTSFSARLIGALRAAGAAIIVAGGRDQISLTAAADFVSRCAGVEITADQLLDDVLDVRLDIRLRGDLMLLAEDLTDDGARSILGAMTRLAQACDDVGAALAVVERCGELIG